VDSSSLQTDSHPESVGLVDGRRPSGTTETAFTKWLTSGQSNLTTRRTEWPTFLMWYHTHTHTHTHTDWQR